MNYPVGKGGVFQRLINLMPPHEVHIETHLCGGAIMRNKRPAKRNIGIEIDPKVIRMWRNVKPGTSRFRQIDTELIQADATAYLKSYQFRVNDLVYCDPPYLFSAILLAGKKDSGEDGKPECKQKL